MNSSHSSVAETVRFNPRQPFGVDAHGFRVSLVCGHDELEQPWPPAHEEFRPTAFVYPRLKAVRGRVVIARPKNVGYQIDRQFMRDCLAYATERQSLVTYSTVGSGASHAACHAQGWPLAELTSGLFDPALENRLVPFFGAGENSALPAVEASLRDMPPFVYAVRFKSTEHGQLAAAVCDVVSAYDGGQTVNLAIQPLSEGSIAAFVIARRRDHLCRSHVTGRPRGWRVAAVEMAGVLQVTSDSELELMQDPDTIRDLYESVQNASPSDRVKFRNVIDNL